MQMIPSKILTGASYQYAFRHSASRTPIISFPNSFSAVEYWTTGVKLSVLLLLSRSIAIRGFTAVVPLRSACPLRTTVGASGGRSLARYEPRAFSRHLVFSTSESVNSATSSNGSSETRSSTSATSATTDSSNIIDGKGIAAEIRNELKSRIADISKEGLPTPGLAVVLVGSRRDSQTYVNMKKKACAEIGIASFGYDYDESVSETELLRRIKDLNANPNVHGILIQLPLPSHLDEDTILRAVDPAKDVDGLHPENVARLALQGTHGNNQGFWQDLDKLPFSVPCTPLGCLELLDRSGIELAGQNAVVIGRSNLVGLPVSLLLLHRNATVTVVHSETRDIARAVAQADIVISAAGCAGLVKDFWLKDGAVVLDVGINSVDLPPEQVQKGKRPYRLVGDVDFESASRKCSLITPVPGGVGPMTIAMLLRNTVNASVRIHTNNNSVS